MRLIGKMLSISVCFLGGISLAASSRYLSDPQMRDSFLYGGFIIALSSVPIAYRTVENYFGPPFLLPPPMENAPSYQAVDDSSESEFHTVDLNSP